MEITVKVFRTKFTFTSKKDGTQKESEVLALEFGNGKQIRLFEDKWNYRTIDYLNDLLDDQAK
jgi:hypothetical protein